MSVGVQSIINLNPSPTMKPTITKHQLMTALLTGGPLNPTTGMQFTIVNGVAREDGSNHSYNVTGISGGVEVTVCLRTID